LNDNGNSYRQPGSVGDGCVLNAITDGTAGEDLERAFSSSGKDGMGMMAYWFSGRLGGFHP